MLSIVKSGNDGVELTWTEPDANVEYYIISYGHEPGQELYGVPNTGKTTSFRIGALDLNQTYYFRVRSQKGCAVSAASNELRWPIESTSGQVLGLADTEGQSWWLVLSSMLSGATAVAWGIKQLKAV